jgi:hypothetical protein
MQSPRRIEFRLDAHVNGQTFTMNGDGSGDVGAGTCSLFLEASPAFPTGFDPRSCPLICSQPTSLLFARSADGASSWLHITSGDYEVFPNRQGVIHDEDGRLLLDLRVSSRIRMAGDTLVSEHTMHGVSELPSIAHYETPADEIIVPAAQAQATTLLRYTIVSADGRRFIGVTTVPYRWRGDDLRAPLVRTVEDVRVDWDGGTKVAAHYRTSLRPFAANPWTPDLADLPSTPEPVSIG